MNLGANARVLLTATQELERKWAETKECWRDQKSLEFEREHLADLFATVDRTAIIFEQIDRLLEAARRDCE